MFNSEVAYRSNLAVPSEKIERSAGSERFIAEVPAETRELLHVCFRHPTAPKDTLNLQVARPN